MLGWARGCIFVETKNPQVSPLVVAWGPVRVLVGAWWDRRKNLSYFRHYTYVSHMKIMYGTLYVTYVSCGLPGIVITKCGQDFYTTLQKFANNF